MMFSCLCRSLRGVHHRGAGVFSAVTGHDAPVTPVTHVTQVTHVTHVTPRLRAAIHTHQGALYVKQSAPKCIRSDLRTEPINWDDDEERRLIGLDDAADHASILDRLPAADARRLKILELEYDVWMSLGGLLPTAMSPARWVELLFRAGSVAARRRRYRYWHGLEKQGERDSQKKAQRAVAHADRLREHEERIRAAPGGILPPKNTYMLFARNPTMNRHYCAQLAHAYAHGSTLVFDCEYESSMSERELKNVGQQLAYCHGVNKMASHPFYFHVAGLAPGGRLAYHTHRALGDHSAIPMGMTAAPYTQSFDRDRLVYLSPNARDTLESFDHDAVYVVGAIVDKSEERPLTRAAAKRDGVRAVKLPLDRYLDWHIGRKSLTLDQVLSILLELKCHGDWQRALTHVPQRKLNRSQHRWPQSR